MNRFDPPFAALRPVARFLSATAVVALGATAGIAQTGDGVPRGASSIWVVQPKVTVAGEMIAAGQAIALEVGPAADDPQDMRQTAQAATTSDAEPPAASDANADAPAPDADADAAAPDADAAASDADADAAASDADADADADAAASDATEGEAQEGEAEADASEGASDSAASPDATAAEPSADAPEEAFSENPPDGETPENSGAASQDEPGSDASQAGAGSAETEAEAAESAVEPDNDAGTEEVAPEESAILPSAEDQEETEAKTMATDCVKRPEGCLTPIENEVEGPSLSDTPATPDSAEKDSDGAVPVVVEK